MKRERLLRERSAKGLTQAEVAATLCITTSYYGMIEQGVRNPRLHLALEMERLFGLPASALFLDLFCANGHNAMLGHQGEVPTRA